MKSLLSRLDFDIAFGMDCLTSTSEHRRWPLLCSGLLLMLVAAGCSANLPQTGGLTKPDGPAPVTTATPGSPAVVPPHVRTRSDDCCRRQRRDH